MSIRGNAVHGRKNCVLMLRKIPPFPPLQRGEIEITHDNTVKTVSWHANSAKYVLKSAPREVKTLVLTTSSLDAGCEPHLRLWVEQ